MRRVYLMNTSDGFFSEMFVYALPLCFHFVSLLLNFSHSVSLHRQHRSDWIWCSCFPPWHSLCLRFWDTLFSVGFTLSVSIFFATNKCSFQYGDKQCARIRCVFPKPWGNYQLLLMGVSTSKEPKCKQMIRNNDDEMPETHRQWLNINYVCTILVTCPFYVNILQA